MVPYEGMRSHEPSYNFCYLCKERLETVQDETDECWYFVGTKQVRYNTADGKSCTVNVHAVCMAEIEQQHGTRSSGSGSGEKEALSGSLKSKVAPQATSEVGSGSATGAGVSKAKAESSAAAKAGQKRTYVEA